MRTTFKLTVFLIILTALLFSACSIDDESRPIYTVTYASNGADSGNAPVDLSYYEQGQTVTLLANTGNLVKTGHTFAGWCVNADGTGTNYTQGQTFVVGSVNVTLFVKWTTQNPTYTVTYEGNGNTSGSVPTDSTNYEEATSVTLPANTGNLVKTGHTFAGWCVNADGTGTNYTQGQTFIMGSGNVTLFAKWTQNPTYTVTYDGNGNTRGSVPTDSTNYEVTATVTVLANTGGLMKTCNTFTGWNTQANGAGTILAPFSTFEIGESNVTLYVKWEEAILNTWYRNADSDGFGNSSITVQSCTQPVGYVAVSGDCDDATASIYPGAYEIPGDSIDQDCNSGEACYTDADGDNFGTNVIMYSADSDCTDVGESPNQSDCDDLNSTSFPSAMEINNGVDDNCNGKIDEGFPHKK